MWGRMEPLEVVESVKDNVDDEASAKFDYIGCEL